MNIKLMETEPERDDFAGIGTYYSCRGPVFDFQYPHNGSQPFTSTVPGDGVEMHVMYLQVYRHNIHHRDVK